MKPLFDCFVKVRKIGFPFSHSASRPFSAFFGENEADTFEFTDVERGPRSNFLDHFHYFQAVTFWVIALNRQFFRFFCVSVIVTYPKMRRFRETGLFRDFSGLFQDRWLYQMEAKDQTFILICVPKKSIHPLPRYWGVKIPPRKKW